MTALSGDRISFRRVAPGDYAMLGGWMARPHWREWWGEPETELGNIRDMVEGRDTTCRPCLFLIDSEPAGYIQVWDIGPHQVPAWIADHTWLAELPADAVGVDLSLADGASLGKGIGSAVLRRFVDDLRAKGHDTVVIDPDPKNLRAVASYRRAGFRPVPHLEGRTDGVLIMQFDPDSAFP